MHFNNLYNTPGQKRFWAPTRIISGIGCRQMAMDLLLPDCPTLLVVDAHFVEHPFIAAISKHTGNLLFKIAVSGEPRMDLVEDALGLIGDNQWNQLLALGGGSTIDLAKALLAHRTFGGFHRIGYGTMREIPDLWPFENGCMFVAIPTTAGTGSETSRYYLLSDPETHQKSVSRSWTLCPSIALLDPFFLEQMSESLMVMGAFDAFTHLWETHFCAQEGSLMVKALAKEGMSLILKRMLDLEHRKNLDEQGLCDLQMASAWGGIALSNVRTGLLHTSGEALAAQMDLPHPLTLWVFFRANILLLRSTYQREGEDLFRHLGLVLGCRPEDLIDTLQGVWERAFQRTGCEYRLIEAFRQRRPQVGPILDMVISDRVLLDKEAPENLNDEQVRDFIVNGLCNWI